MSPFLILSGRYRAAATSLKGRKCPFAEVALPASTGQFRDYRRFPKGDGRARAIESDPHRDRR